jgi:hypothetical protein
VGDSRERCPEWGRRVVGRQSADLFPDSRDRPSGHRSHARLCAYRIQPGNSADPWRRSDRRCSDGTGCARRPHSSDARCSYGIGRAQGSCTGHPWRPHSVCAC